MIKYAHTHRILSSAPKGCVHDDLYFVLDNLWLFGSVLNDSGAEMWRIINEATKVSYFIVNSAWIKSQAELLIKIWRERAWK